MFGTEKEKIVAVADIGSGSAGFSILSSHPKKGVHILAAHRSILPLETRTREQTITGVVRMLSEASDEVSKSYSASDTGKKMGPPVEVHAVIRAPWTRASTGRATKKFENETAITKAMITDTAHEAFANNKDLDHSNLLETSVIRVELNEYPVANPLTKRAHRLDVVTFQSDCDPILKKGIVTALESNFPGRPVTVRSGARTFLQIVQEKFEHPDTYVIMDMVSEATTVMAVCEGVITHHTIFMEGVRTILRRITGAKDTPEGMANLMRMVVAGSCSDAECERLNEAFAKVEPDLVRVFGEAVGGLMGKRRLPDTLILFAHPDIAGWLAHVFSRIDYAQFTIPLRPFTVKTITPDELTSIMNVKTDVQTDTGILVAAIVNM